jgi:ribosome biogenesis GTPase
VGRVVAAFGQRAVIRDERGERHPAFVGRRGLRVVCGDEVRWQPTGDAGEGVVLAHLPRRTELTRPNRRGRAEVLAANLDLLAVVVAPEPPVDPFVTDRYLAAAEAMGCAAVVVSNKCDLDGPAPPALDEYAGIGYPVIAVSALDGAGTEELAGALAGHCSILVGQSGVGKSSLLNALVPGSEAVTGSLSGATGEGRHTTSATVLHELPGGGELIDSPGVRDFAPALDDPALAVRGFREIAAAAPHCRFADCRHLKEPGCAVKAGVEAGAISHRRYESYRRLRRLTEDLGKPGWA